MKYVLLTLFALLTACTQNTMNEQKADNTPSIQKPQEINKPNQTLTAKDIKHPQGKTATPSEIAECQKQGGTISKQGLMAHDFCVVEFADKGKVCSDGDDCQAGRCVAENVANNIEIGSAKGVCPSNNIPFGCYAIVNNGNFDFLCVD